MKYSHLLSSILFLFLISTKSQFSQTIIPDGPVSGNWTLVNSPYLINGNIEILDDSTLTIDPGVRIEFQGHYALNVQGVLLAEGTETDTIIFTVNDTTGFNDLNSTLGGWNGINIIDPDTTNDSTIINYCKFEFAKAVDDVWFLNAGGALTILNFDKVHISNSLFQNNSAGGDTTEVPAGGAIHLAWSDVKFTNNTFICNRALSGGAIQFHESSPTFINNTFIDNYARHSSGAVDAGSKSSPTFYGDQFLSNSSRYNGGGISLWDSTVTTLENVIISDNLSRDGGGFYSHHAEIIFSNCSINNNIANSSGGGLNSYMSELTFESCTFSEDSATIFGGGIAANHSTLIFDECTFFDNKSDFQSGAINAWRCELTINESNFNSNSSEINYGAIGADSCSIIIDQTQFELNSSVWGGGLSANFGNLELTNSTFISNTSEHGGGLISGWNDNQLSNVTFTQNSSIWGGAMSITNCNLNISDCNFQNNQAGDAGAFEYIADTMAFEGAYDVNIIRTNFSDNNADGAVGTCSFTQLNTENSLININIDKCNIVNNSADRVNILISSHIKDFKVSNSILNGNNTIRRTAGCNFANNVSGMVENCLFYSNYTTGGSSAASVGLNSNVAFVNCTFANNYGENGGALTLRNEGNMLLLNSILWGNKPYNSVLAAVTDSTPCVLDIYYSDLEYGTDSLLINDSISAINWGIGNINSDPLFVNNQDNFSLLDNSPCIGAGIDSMLINDEWYFSPIYDLEGNPRPSPESSNPDLGAYEHSNGMPTNVKEIEVIPEIFELAQNYPNPFNPSTTIRYTIPPPSADGVNGEWPARTQEGAIVNLLVYDILGREVVTLVNEKQRPGIYEVYWNPSADGLRLSSGIYYYNIIIGEFIETKQMILLK